MERLPTTQALSKLSELWDIHELVFVRKMENIVYSGIKDGKPAYLRLTLPSRSSKERIISELDWLSYLSQFNLPIVYPLKNSCGAYFSVFENTNESYTSCVFAGLPGTRATQELAESPEFLRQIGRLTAQLHCASENYQPSTQIQRRDEWNRERGIQHALTQLQYTQQLQLKSRFSDLVSKMHTLPRSPKTYGLIHADIGLGNLLVTDNHRIHLIDFDDSCYHWFAFDLAVTMTSIFGRFSEKILQGILTGYQEFRNITDVEIQSVSILQEYMLLRLYFWIEHHQRLETFHESQQLRVDEMRAQILHLFLN